MWNGQASAETQSVRSVERALEILNILAEEGRLMGIPEISRRTTLPKSTVHRLLVTLERAGFAEQDQTNQQYRLGLRVFHLGSVVLDQMDLVQCARPLMRRLQATLGETVTLNVVNGLERVTVAKVDARHDLRQYAKLGARAPLYAGSGSKCLLAFLDPDTIQHVIYQSPMQAITPNTVIDPQRVEAELEEIRRKGAALSREERVIGAFSISAPIFDHTGQLAGGLTVSGAAVRLPLDQEDALVEQVKATAGEISAAMGYQLGSGSGTKWF